MRAWESGWLEHFGPPISFTNELQNPSSSGASLHQGWTLCSAVVGVSAPASLPTPTPFQNMPHGRAKLSQHTEEDHSLVWAILVASSASDKFSGPICCIKAEHILHGPFGFPVHLQISWAWTSKGFLETLG